MLVTIACIGVEQVLGSSVPTLTVCACSQAALLVLFGACLRVSVLRRLTHVAGCYHYTISIIAGRTASCILEGQRYWIVDGWTQHT